MGKVKIMNHKDGSVKVVLTAVVVNSFVTLAKSTGWMFSLSPSMLAEAIHSFGDTANQITGISWNSDIQGRSHSRISCRWYGE